jgi:FlaA1/EpsC-like NDP-sugar epimerase
MENIDIVFHAAAMKHVPACEYNPFEAVQTNVLGTQNVITSAHEAGVRRVVVISTDKAASPENTMGATKLLTERLVVAAQQSCQRITLCAVRFGNVIGSRGSLAPRVLRQLGEEGRATLTHPEMTRFMMTIDDAVTLVLEAGARACGGEIFILRMPVLRVKDLIEVLCESQARRRGLEPSVFPIDVVGIRPGEKLHEALMTVEESRRARYEREGLFVVDPPGSGNGERAAIEVGLPLDSSAGPFLARDHILELLERSGVLGRQLEEATVSAGVALA